MIATILLLLTAKIPVGAYSMPALCKELEQATGETYTANINLKDYPVFVAVKSGDPERVKTLVADALHAEWLKEGKINTLAPLPISKENDFALFETLFKASIPKDSVLADLPLKDLYEMRPGEILRYGDIVTNSVKPWPKPEGKTEIPRQLIVLRSGPGSYEYRNDSGTNGIAFEAIPTVVSDLVKDHLETVAIDSKKKAAMRKIFEDFQSNNLDFSDLSKKDPIATMAEMVLSPVAEAIPQDLVVALPDLDLYPLSSIEGSPGTVKAILSLFSMSVNWGVTDGALVGRLSSCEIRNSTQAKREVLGRFVKGIGAKGIGNVAVLGEYVRSQRPSSSDSWVDALLLALASVVIDEEYVGDYPHNIRLFTSLTPRDWDVINQKEPFPLSSLSPTAQKGVLNLLLQSRSRLRGSRSHQAIQSDPGWWNTLNPRDLSVTAEIVEEPVLICWSSFTNGVMTIRDAAINFTRRVGSNGHEPVFQQARRRKLKLTISPPQSTAFVETGFSEVTVTDLKDKPVPYTKLPTDIRKAFEQAIKEQNSKDGPPPVRVNP
jgi:hypothetical protein